MKELLKDYLSTLREEESLKAKKSELIKQLLHSELPNGNEIYDIILNDRIVVKRSLQENMPDNATDDEIYKATFICDELYWAKRAEDKIVEDYGYWLPLEGSITDGSHEGW